MLSSIEDDALGEELQVVWELEPGTSVQQTLSLPEPSGFDLPARLETFLNAVRWGAASTADVRSIQSPFRSGIEQRGDSFFDKKTEIAHQWFENHAKNFSPGIESVSYVPMR